MRQRGARGIAYLQGDRMIAKATSFINGRALPPRSRVRRFGFIFVDFSLNLA